MGTYTYIGEDEYYRQRKSGEVALLKAKNPLSIFLCTTIATILTLAGTFGDKAPSEAYAVIVVALFLISLFSYFDTKDKIDACIETRDRDSRGLR